MIEKLTTWYQGLPDRKKNLDFFVAFLTIPLLLTLIVGNILNLRKKTDDDNLTPTIIITQKEESKTDNISPAVISPSLQPSPFTSPTSFECIKDIGPIVITSPKENEVVSDIPICLEISYNQGNYCSVVWSYRINSGKWSEYVDKSICLYNQPSGSTKFELRVKSLVSNKEIILERNFIVAASPSPIPTNTVAPLSPTPLIPSL